jgi:hypothetical protein
MGSYTSYYIMEKIGVYLMREAIRIIDDRNTGRQHVLERPTDL